MDCGGDVHFIDIFMARCRSICESSDDAFRNGNQDLCVGAQLAADKTPMAGHRPITALVYLVCMAMAFLSLV